MPLSDRAQQPSPGSNAQAPASVPPSGQAQQGPQKSQTTITLEVNLVDVLFTVLNRRNKLVPDLDKTDFKVLDDNVQQEIRYFSRQSDLPLRIGMLLDTSNSVREPHQVRAGSSRQLSLQRDPPRQGPGFRYDLR